MSIYDIFGYSTQLPHWWAFIVFPLINEVETKAASRNKKKFPKMLLLSHRESEVVKTSGSSDDNKKEFFETASHVLKNSGLFQGADVWIPFKARGCERSVQLRANKRGFFKIAPHILENHRLLLRSCFLNTVYSFLEILKKTEFWLSLWLLYCSIIEKIQLKNSLQSYDIYSIMAIFLSLSLY